MISCSRADFSCLFLLSSAKRKATVIFPRIHSIDFDSDSVFFLSLFFSPGIATLQVYSFLNIRHNVKCVSPVCLCRVYITPYTIIFAILLSRDAHARDASMSNILYATSDAIPNKVVFPVEMEGNEIFNKKALSSENSLPF